MWYGLFGGGDSLLLLLLPGGFYADFVGAGRWGAYFIYTYRILGGKGAWAFAAVVAF